MIKSSLSLVKDEICTNITLTDSLNLMYIHAKEVTTYIYIHMIHLFSWHLSVKMSQLYSLSPESGDRGWRGNGRDGVG